ncbi:hypothetical protein BJ508DRAFT_325180 [Ascobolus immersus RN42]|uniref:Uncharacterized protein n=1 Tax=Ascobolus immersus RN42 TaxID=1160509 RepID=A0A3N4IM87_ASCIM|nr:hypothetical protein BJ508DRAFT_325180 [Ascobolus immersus RN42]
MSFGGRPKPTPYAQLNNLLSLSRSDPRLKNATPLTRDPPSNYDSELKSSISDLKQHTSTLQSELSDLQSRLPDTISDVTKLRALTLAHEKASKELGWTPPKDSPLDSLLAYRNTLNTTKQLEEAISHLDGHLTRLRADVTTEENHLASAKQLNTALQEHLAELEEEALQIQQGGSQLREKRKKEAAEKAKLTRQEARKLVRGLMSFIDNNLSLMLAAQLAGGPKVGQELDTDALEIWVEKANTGKAKKGTLDAMWGNKDKGDARDLREEAGKEMKRLLEELMNASLETSPYVQVEEDSPFVRFLVLAGVAVGHPRDAGKLKLVDFGRTLEES